MLTFIIPLLLGTILGFLIRGKPSDTFAITKGRRVAWGIGIALGGVAIGTPVGLSISSTTGPQIAGLIGAGLGFGVFNILSIENATYKKWSDRNALAWVGGTIVALSLLAGFLPNEIKGIFPSYAQDGRVAVDDGVRTQGTSQSKQPAFSNIDSYLGVRLGMSETEVTYLLGVPQEADQNPKGALWFYEKSGESSAKFIVFDGGKVVLIGCQSNCPPLAGIRLYDSEDVVIERLKAIAGYEFDEKQNAAIRRPIYGWFSKDKSGDVSKNIEAATPPVWIVLSRGRVQLLSLISEEYRRSKESTRYDSPRFPIN